MAALANRSRRPAPRNTRRYNVATPNRTTNANEENQKDPRKELMNRIELEHQYTRREKQYIDGVSSLVNMFKIYIDETYADHNIKFTNIPPSRLAYEIKDFFDSKYVVTQGFEYLIEQMGMKSNLSSEYEYLRRLNLDERYEILNDVRNILDNFENTLSDRNEREANRNGRTNSKTTGGKRKSHRTKRKKR